MKPVEFMIRRATAADADAIFTLLCQFATSFRPERQSFDLCLRELLAEESAWLAVAESGAAVIGYCLGFDHVAFYANGRVGWLEEITVEPELRRKGVGRALMNAFEQWAGARGAILVGLATRRAAPFYTALGYEESAMYYRKVILR